MCGALAAFFSECVLGPMRWSYVPGGTLQGGAQAAAGELGTSRSCRAVGLPALLACGAQGVNAACSRRE